MAGIMKQLLLNIYFWLMFIIVTVLFFVFLPLLILVWAVFGGKTVDSAVRWGIVIYGWILVKFIPFFAPVRVEYQMEQPPLPAILIANHSSAIDPYLFGALLIDACFVSTWPFKIPFYGYCMRLAKYVDANEGWEKVCQKGAAILQSGTSLIIWPEGHRSRDGNLGRFKNGAFALAVNTGYPLLPVCIIGTRQFLPPGKKGILAPSLIKLVVLDPIYPDMQNDREQEIIRLRNKAHEAINKALHEKSEFLTFSTLKVLKEEKNAD